MGQAPDLTWQKGGSARLVRIEGGDAVVFLSTISSPPGSRLDGELVLTKLAMRLKIHGCKLQPNGEFELKGRLLDVTRGVRAEFDFNRT